MPHPKLTAHDYGWLYECYQSSLADCEANGWEYDGEVVMTSVGYVELWGDGEVDGGSRSLCDLSEFYITTNGNGSDGREVLCNGDGEVVASRKKGDLEWE